MPRNLQVNLNSDYGSRRAEADSVLQAIRTHATAIDGTLADTALSMAAVDDMVPPYPPFFAEYCFQKQHNLILQRAKDHIAQAAGMLALYKERLDCLAAPGQNLAPTFGAETTDASGMHCLAMDSVAYALY